MATILEKKLLRAPDVFYFKIAAPLISKKAQPGQFVIVRLHDRGERIPLSLADIDPAAGTISLIVMAVGKTTSEMAALKPGEALLDLCGPLGNPTEIERVGTVVLVGGGFGTAPLYPIARGFKAARQRGGDHHGCAVQGSADLRSRNDPGKRPGRHRHRRRQQGHEGHRDHGPQERTWISAAQTSSSPSVRR